MNEELERLRAVARASAAFLKAEDEAAVPVQALRDEGGEPSPEMEQEIRRLWEIASNRRDELAEALARLREVNPELVN
jgi:hypothetical protein